MKPRALPGPPRTGPPRLPPPRIAPPPGWYADRPGPFFFDFYLDFWIPPRPLVFAPVENEPWYSADPPGPLAYDAPPPPDESPPPGEIASPGESALPGAPPPPEAELEPEPAGVSLQLSPLAEEVNFRVEDRGFFDGPQTAIQLDLLDRATGRLLWTKAVNAESDPLDAKAVSRVLDEAFADASWSRQRTGSSR